MTPAQSMIQMGFSFISARAIYVAAKLGIADHVRNGAISADELSRKLSTNVDALFRLMRFLTAIDVLEQLDSGEFLLSPLGETLRSDSSQSVRDYVILQHELAFPALRHLQEVVRTGESADLKTFGQPVFELIKSDQNFASMFYKGLASRSKIDIAAIVDAYDFSNAKKIADIGGGNGSLLSAILSKYAKTTGILFDLAPAIEEARTGRGGPLPRCEFLVGDFFQEIPSIADTYLLKLVLHDWGSEDACRILRSCRSAMVAGDRLLIIEGLIGSSNKLTLTNFVDLAMMAAYSGRERNQKEIEALLDQVGLRLRRMIPTTSDLQIMETIPA